MELLAIYEEMKPQQIVECDVEECVKRPIRKGIWMQNVEGITLNRRAKQHLMSVTQKDPSH